MSSRVRTGLAITTVCAAAVACALASPFALAMARRWPNVEWADLADVGQAYGAASAAFSALAVAGVAAGLIFQGRQLRLAQIQAAKDFQTAARALRYWFSARRGRTYWATAGDDWSASDNATTRRLVIIAAREYSRATASGPIPPRESAVLPLQGRPPHMPASRRGAAAVSALVVGAAAVGWLLGRRR
ncbi:DUF6082 family protein [Dactylosporangium sp. CS-033363]|uniref:DUF6082 family protein n=1 Tax=Dactylosporangium sp. CS-033363 TaxID=3239935 RepID=UPI003D9364D3